MLNGYVLESEETHSGLGVCASVSAYIRFCTAQASGRRSNPRAACPDK